MLLVKNLNKSFQGIPLLKDICFEQPMGSIAVFLGPSGCGKSTLFRIFNNLESLDSGEIYLEGKQLNLKDLHSKKLMTMVFQSFQSFNNLTVQDNILVALKYSLKIPKHNLQAIAIEYLQKYHLLEYANHYPAQLSGGQKQRLAIARAIAIQPKVICMDEPTSALDSTLREELRNQIHQLKKERYLILITSHDTTFVNSLDATFYQLHNKQLYLL